MTIEGSGARSKLFMIYFDTTERSLFHPRRALSVTRGSYQRRLMMAIVMRDTQTSWSRALLISTVHT